MTDQAAERTLQQIHDLLNNDSITQGKEFKLRVAQGLVPGTAIFEKYGKNPDVTTGAAPEDVWNGGGLYTGFPTGAAETMEIFSSSGDDTLLGAGARTVLIKHLLDADGAVSPDVVVELDGMTPVALDAIPYFRGGSRMKVLTAGVDGENAGTLTLRHTTTTANIFAVLPIGRNQTAIGAFTVPLGKTLFMDRATMSMARDAAAAASADTTFRARPLGGVFNAIFSAEITTSQSWQFENNGWIEFAALTDIKMRVESVTATVAVAGEFSGLLVDD